MDVRTGAAEAEAGWLHKGKYLLHFLAAFLVAALLLGDVPVHANQQSQSVVKIGFPIQARISYVNEQGDYAGYLVDYLQQLNLFTNRAKSI